MKTKNALFFALLFLLSACSPFGKEDPETVRALVVQVNDHWQNTHPDPGRAFWHQSAYQTGNMAAYHLTAKPEYLNYALAWAEKNQWQGATSNDTANWKYTYGEGPAYVLFGDWQICFQVYCELYALAPDTQKIERARAVMEYQMATEANDYWWWVDGLYMVMPVMTKLYQLTGNQLYLDKLADYFHYARDLMYDAESGLFFRDAKYIYPKHQTQQGQKDFWARGNGWLFAAIPRVLTDLPTKEPLYTELVVLYQQMAESLATLQQPEGYWTRSLMDPEQAPGPETSGTAFFTYGFLWGLNQGLLSEDAYAKTMEKAWAYLKETAVQADGSVGYVQPIGENAMPGQVVDQQSTSDFGVGAFLLAATERVRYLETYGK